MLFMKINPVPVLLRLGRFVLRLVFGIFAGAGILVCLLYLRAGIYDFPPPIPFAGQNIYNPYEGANDTAYLRANFHAHSIAWGGLTNGHDTEKEIYHGYTGRGYEVACISNYHSISEYHKDLTKYYVPVYEHGFNVLKSHCLALGADEVSFMDFPLLQASSHQQSVIDDIKSNGAMVCIAHPDFGGGRTYENMRELTGYVFTEVLNHYRLSDEYWDEGLSAGRLSWILGNDDTHDMRDHFTFHRFTMVPGSCHNGDEVLKSLLKGRHFAVRSHNGQPDISFLSCQGTGDGSYTFSFAGPVDSIIIVGQGGRTLKSVSRTTKTEYRFRPEDNYIRAVAVSGNSILYLNPLIRCNDSSDPFAYMPAAAENSLMTWAYRLAVLIWMVLLAYLLVKTVRR